MSLDAPTLLMLLLEDLSLLLLMLLIGPHTKAEFSITARQV